MKPGKPMFHTAEYSKATPVAAGEETSKGPAIKRLEIWSGKQGKKVGDAANLKSARRLVDKYDNKYGAYDHYIKRD